jgi:amidophosphoribosyltransferase
LNVKLKFNTVGGVLKDKRVVVVGDSIVRGTTLAKLTALLRKAGAKEVHIRVSSPPIRFPCFYGMDFPTKSELVASERSVEEIKRILNVDSLCYLSIEKLLASVPSELGGYCCSCFDGQYPLPVDSDISKLQLETGPALLKV